MRSLSLTAIPLLLLYSVSAYGEVFKCTIADKVEYRDIPCAANAEQQVIALSNDSQCGVTPSVDAAAVAAQLRLADQALSERLAREHELRMQIAAQEALAAQQERIARETREAAELQYGNNAVPVVGMYLPFGSFRRHVGEHFDGRKHMFAAPSHQLHRHLANQVSFAAHRQSPIHSGAFATNVMFE